jgi:hypothetical protein
MGFSPTSGFGFCASCGTPRPGPAGGVCANCGTALAALEVAPPVPPAQPAYTPPPAPAYTLPAAEAAPVPPPPPAYDQPTIYGQPPASYAPVYAPAPPRKGVSPAVLIGGVVVVILVAVGAFFLLNNANGGKGGTGVSAASSGVIQPTNAIATQAPTLSPTVAPKTGSVTFNPSTVSCDHPEAFSTILTLPASVGENDTITEVYDGKTVGSFTIANDGSFKQAADGSWAVTWTSTVAHMAAICANGGVDAQGGAALFTPGDHIFAFYSAAITDSALAKGSYTVLKPTATPQIVYVTPAPTVAATPASTSWQVFSDYETADQALQLADTQAWNDASNPNTTYAAATKVRADRQADLAWLKANPPMDCYSVLYNDLMLYDNQDITAMNDWFAGRYDTLNNVDLPLVNATSNRISTELADGYAACG